MAARLNRTPWRFYVYTLGPNEVPWYIGKGSGRRLLGQKARRGLPGREIARFGRESDAYAFEKALIGELKPFLNRSPGGEGPRSKRVYLGEYPDKFTRELNRFGPRRYVARWLLSKDLSRFYSPSKVEEIRAQFREVLNGAWA